MKIQMDSVSSHNRRTNFPRGTEPLWLILFSSSNEATVSTLIVLW